MAALAEHGDALLRARTSTTSEVMMAAVEPPDCLPPPQEDPSKPRKTFGRIVHNGRRKWCSCPALGFVGGWGLLLLEEKPRVLTGRNAPVFVVPQTHDMVSTLLSPSTPKKAIDLLILGVLAVHIGLYFALPTALRTPVLLLLFLFWRASYNVGLGYLLRAQSKYGQLVYWAKKYAIFDPESPFYSYIREDIESKVQHEVESGDYAFDDAPIEYNTWLVFRRLVDLILMSDFVSYVLMAMSCATQPVNEEWYFTVGRWAGGAVLFLFNLWVKLDAHRVVKDYAWCKCCFSRHMFPATCSPSCFPPRHVRRLHVAVANHLRPPRRLG